MEAALALLASKGEDDLATDMEVAAEEEDTATATVAARTRSAVWR
jgi:hypothetical protein